MEEFIWIVFVAFPCEKCGNDLRVDGAYRDEQVAEERVKKLSENYADNVYKEKYSIR